MTSMKILVNVFPLFLSSICVCTVQRFGHIHSIIQCLFSIFIIFYIVETLRGSVSIQ